MVKKNPSGETDAQIPAAPMLKFRRFSVRSRMDILLAKDFDGSVLAKVLKVLEAV